MIGTHEHDVQNSNTLSELWKCPMLLGRLSLEDTILKADGLDQNKFNQHKGTGWCTYPKSWPLVMKVLDLQCQASMLDLYKAVDFLISSKFGLNENTCCQAVCIASEKAHTESSWKRSWLIDKTASTRSTIRIRWHALGARRPWSIVCSRFSYVSAEWSQVGQ